MAHGKYGKKNIAGSIDRDSTVHNLLWGEMLMLFLFSSSINMLRIVENKFLLSLKTHCLSMVLTNKDKGKGTA
jgi:hypothetical protein